MGNFGRITVKRYLRKNYHYIPDTILKKIATPKNIIVEPIAGCNVVCSACPCDILKRPYGLMKFSTFRNVVDKTHPTKIGLYFMGEPFLNPEIFRIVLNKIDATPSETVHIGDSVEADMYGARDSGITGIWIKTPNQPQWNGYAINSICELGTILRKLENGEHS